VEIRDNMAMRMRHDLRASVTRQNPLAADHDRNFHALVRHARQARLKLISLWRIGRVILDRFIDRSRNAALAGKLRGTNGRDDSGRHV
jgi:hypothetical protein